MNDEQLQALKIAYSYMPQAIEVTRHQYGDHYAVILEHIETVRSALLDCGVDPDEVAGEIHPGQAPNSCY